MSYIGAEPIVSATRTVTEVTATAGQTVFNANGGYTVGYLDVFLNGSKLTSTDFTATNGSSITLTEAAQVGDIVRLEAWGTFSTSTAVLRAGDTMTGALLLPDGSASAPALSNDGDSNTGIFFPAADTIAFAEGGTEAMRIDSSGNVGIGTSSPTQEMELRKDQAGGTQFKVTNKTNSGAATAGVNFENSTSDSATISLWDSGSIGAYSAYGLGIGHLGTGGIAIVAEQASASIRFATGGTTERMRITYDGFLRFNSGYGSVATAYGCRAWVNFNGTGTVAIRASGNVSSITDNGNGNYRVNFSTALPDANYSVCGGASSSNCEAVIRMSSYATGNVAIGIVDSNLPAFTDDSLISVAVFR